MAHSAHAQWLVFSHSPCNVSDECADAGGLIQALVLFGSLQLCHVLANKINENFWMYYSQMRGDVL